MIWPWSRIKHLEQEIRQFADRFRIHDIAFINMARHFQEKCPEMTSVACNPVALVRRYEGYAENYGIESKASYPPLPASRQQFDLQVLRYKIERCRNRASEDFEKLVQYRNRTNGSCVTIAEIDYRAMEKCCNLVLAFIDEAQRDPHAELAHILCQDIGSQEYFDKESCKTKSNK